VTRRRFPLWIVLGVVLVVALAAGSGAFDRSPPTAAQRAEAIESGIRCPSCEDLSVADSSAETAVIVRAVVRQQIAEGRTDQQIRSYLAARYGSSVVLDPPASGLSLVVWVVPLAAGTVAVAALAVVFARRRRTAAVGPAEAALLEAEADAGADPDELEDRRRFLERSLSDTEAEFEAGDLSDDDYRVLRSRDTARLATLERRRVAVAVGGPTGGAPGAANGGDDPAGRVTPATLSPRPRRSRRQRLLLGGGIATLSVALVLVVAAFATERLPGQTVSGNIDLSQQAQVQQTLAQAATLENEGQSGEAAQLYQQVLNGQPGNEVALAQLGWLEYETGVRSGNAALMADARSKLTRAVHLAPDDYAGRLYLGTLLLQADGNAAGAVTQYRAFLADDPPVDLVQQAAAVLRQAYAKAGVPVPSQVPPTS
jgi:cytochrome c-type biogenesis protein CcmH